MEEVKLHMFRAHWGADTSNTNSVSDIPPGKCFSTSDNTYGLTVCTEWAVLSHRRRRLLFWVKHR
jgi:hypothetical protein